MAVSEKSDRHLISRPSRKVVGKAHEIVEKDYLISNKSVAIAPLMVRFCQTKGLLAGDSRAARGGGAKRLLVDKNNLPKGNDGVAHGGDSRRLDTCAVFAAQPDLVLKSTKFTVSIGDLGGEPCVDQPDLAG